MIGPRTYLMNIYYKHLSNAIFQEVGSLLYKSIRRYILLTLHSYNLQQLQCKNEKLHKLISNKKSNKKKDSYTFPIINLTNKDLNTKPLKYGLHHSFTDKNKYVKRNIVVKLESLATSLDFVDQSQTNHRVVVKLRPIIDQTGTYIYKASKVVAYILVLQAITIIH